MGITERREREREEVRRKILEAARELFATEGYERVTMRRIADAIEYSPTTIYNHFEDKEDLLNSLCHEDFSRLLQAFERQPPPRDAVEWIRQLGLAYASFGRENPNHYRFMFMTPNKFEPGHQMSVPGEQTYGLLHAAVVKALETRRFRAGDPEAIAQVLWASIHGAVALLITLPPDKFPHGPVVPDLVEQTIENGIRGFLASPADQAGRV
jgi:AcrR family transcriptional regulator